MTRNALVAVTAVGLKRPVILLTSDLRDLSALTGDHASVQVVRV
jgi:hypothetical protein